ncbi:MAG: hypothetical protein E6J55_07850 [Deltaproteobacteria bacterium]|nr:MAG: hypothetical protein E6J55_07850 [Deltaproteobacteria bacterium]
MTCGRAREFLGRKRAEPRTTADAKRERLGPREAFALTSGTDELYVAKGKKVVHLDLRRSRPDRDALLGLLLGPSGNLRAPAMRVGKTLCIGFAPDMYQAVLG